MCVTYHYGRHHICATIWHRRRSNWPQTDARSVVSRSLFGRCLGEDCLYVIVVQEWIVLNQVLPGFFCNEMPVRLVCLSSFWEALGGGYLMGHSVLYTVVADILPEQERLPCPHVPMLSARVLL